MAPADPRTELAAAQADLQAIEANIVAYQTAAAAEKDKNTRASYNLEVKSLERQKAAAQRRQKIAEVKLRKAEIVSGAGAAAVQEDDWAEHVDAQSGKTFYHNTKTGETSWTKPVTSPGVTTAEEVKTTASAAEWTEHVDPGSGKTFYYNTTTGETSWTQPVAEPQEKSVGDCNTSSDWTEHMDAASGKTFYYNTSTGETSWTRPDHSKTQASATVSELDWSENTDPSTGQLFYYNTKTGETSWTKPSAGNTLPLQTVQPAAATAA